MPFTNAERLRAKALVLRTTVLPCVSMNTVNGFQFRASPWIVSMGADGWWA